MGLTILRSATLDLTTPLHDWALFKIDETALLTSLEKARQRYSLDFVKALKAHLIISEKDRPDSLALISLPFVAESNVAMGIKKPGVSL